MSEALTISASQEPRAHARKACGLCGLPVGRHGTEGVIEGKTFHFCCPGCLHVYRILSNNPDGKPQDFRETDLYKSCVSLGLIRPKEESLSSGGATQAEVRGAPSQVQRPRVDPAAPFVETMTRECTLRIEGMWCTSCSLLIEEVLRRRKGIVEARVSFASDLASVRYLPMEIGEDRIMGLVSKLGYRAHRPGDASPEVTRMRRDLLMRLAIGSFFTMNVMMISLALYLGFFEDLGREGIRYLSYPLWVLSTPVVFYAGYPILKRGIAGLRHGAPSMDTLISIGSLAAYVYSVFQVFRGSLHLYFDTASMLVTILLVGRAIEVRARGVASRGLCDLDGWDRQKVRLQGETDERWVSSESVQPGQRFVVREGERIPVDGSVLSGRGALDESALTGEARPRRKKAGEEVMAGSLLLEGELSLRAVRSASEGCLGQMTKLMHEALTRKSGFELISERIMRWFVPLVLLIGMSTAAAVALTGGSGTESFFRALTVIVITCPCVLSIASPLAKVAAVGAAKQGGILVRNPDIFEGMKGLEALVLDKTGTLTEGRFRLQEVVSLGDQKEVLRRVAAVEKGSSHFIAREIVRAASALGDIEPAQRFEALEGLGVMGFVSGTEVMIGNRKLMEAAGASVPEKFEREARRLGSSGMTVVYFAWEDACRGYLVLGDSIKPEAGETVRRLKSLGLDLWIASGDSKETTAAVAKEVGIDHLLGGALPGEKVELVRRLQEERRYVGMVGDGINDAAALAQADVGIAVGARVIVAPEACDIHLMTDDPGKIVGIIELSARTRRVIRQNLIFAVLYNAAALPIAMAGLINPIIAVLAMFASSLTVIGNTLRIKALA